MLTTFDDLVNECLKTGQSYKLLYVYVKPAQHPDTGEVGFSVLFDAHEPVKPGLTFAGMVAHADAHNDDWELVFVGMAHNTNGSPPTDGQTNEALADMRERILSGKILPNSPIFDRTGKHLSIVRPSGDSSSALH